MNPLARNTDPATSHLAAHEHVASGENARQKAVALSIVKVRPGHTSRELALQSASLDRYAFARRLSDLEHDGLVTKGAARRCAVGGKQSVTWYPVAV